MLLKLQCCNTRELGSNIERDKERRARLQTTSLKPGRLIIFRYYAVLFIPPPWWFELLASMPQCGIGKLRCKSVVQSDTEEMKDILILDKHLGCEFSCFVCSPSCGGHIAVQKC